MRMPRIDLEDDDRPPSPEDLFETVFLLAVAIVFLVGATGLFVWLMFKGGG